MENITVGSRVKLVNLTLSDMTTEIVYSVQTPLGITGEVIKVFKDGWFQVKWVNGYSSCHLRHNLEIIEEEKEELRDVYTLAQNSLEEVGIKVSRQTLKRVAYHVVFGELLFEVMRKEKLDLQTTGVIIAALNKAIIEE